MHSTPAIQINHLIKVFSLPHQLQDTFKERFINLFQKTTYEQFKALDEVNLQIENGDFIGIIGKNGSGKSTLLKIIAGIYTPTSGTVKVHGSLAPFLELGVGFQPELSARENISLNAALLGISKKQLQRHFQNIVDFAGIEKFFDLKMKNFSSGMKARLAFSIAKQADADIYICDEILAVGDEEFQQKCLKVFEEWKHAGKTIILVSHNLGLIEQFCNRAILIEQGKIVKEGKVQEVLTKYHELSSSVIT